MFLSGRIGIKPGEVQIKLFFVGSVTPGEAVSSFRAEEVYQLELPQNYPTFVYSFDGRKRNKRPVLLVRKPATRAVRQRDLSVSASIEAQRASKELAFKKVPRANGLARR